MDADDVPNDLHGGAATLTNLQQSVKDRLGHLIDRGFFVSMSDHGQSQQQHPAISSGITDKIIYDNDLDKDKQKIQQHQRSQQSADQQHGQLQQLQQRVQFPTLYNGVASKKNRVLKASKNVSSNNNKKTKKRKQSALSGSNDSLTEIASTITSPWSANQFALLSELDITYSRNMINTNSTPASNINPASNANFIIIIN